MTNENEREDGEVDEKQSKETPEDGWEIYNHQGLPGISKRIKTDVRNKRKWIGR